MTPTTFECTLCAAPARSAGAGSSSGRGKGGAGYLVVECGRLVQNLYDWRLAVRVRQEERHNILERRAHDLWDSDAQTWQQVNVSPDFAITDPPNRLPSVDIGPYDERSDAGENHTYLSVWSPSTLRGRPY